MNSTYKDKFIQLNKTLWEKTPIKKEIVLVEGRPFVNQIIGSALISRAIQAKKNLPSIVWLRNEEDKSIYESFSIEGFLYKKAFLYKNKVIFLKFIFHFIKFLFKFVFSNKSFDHFINDYEINDVKLGSLIYDMYIKNDFSFLNPRFLDFKFLKILSKTIIEFLCIEKLFETYNIRYTIISKWAYNNSGSLMARISLYRGIKVFTVASDKPRLFHNYQQAFNDVFKINKLNIQDFNLEEIDEKLEHRFSGKNAHFDLASAYSSKIWSKDDFSSYYGSRYKKENKNVFIMLHAFSDANHLDGQMIFTDYYQWFIETLKFVKTLNNKVNWIIKEHPSAIKEYNEHGIVSNGVDKYTSDNIFLLPSEFNTKSIYSIADAVITVRGTIALEASCLGIPSILAGESNFSTHGFTLNMKNKEEYFETLRNMESIDKKIDQEKILLAKKTYHSYDVFDAISSNNDGWVMQPSYRPGQNRDEFNNKNEDYYKKLVLNVDMQNVKTTDKFYKDSLDLLSDT